MEAILIRFDGERKTIQISELDNYPEILFAGGHAFIRRPLGSHEYLEISYWQAPLAETWDFLK